MSFTLPTYHLEVHWPAIQYASVNSATQLHNLSLCNSATLNSAIMNGATDVHVCL